MELSALRTETKSWQRESEEARRMLAELPLKGRASRVYRQFPSKQVAP